MWRSAYREQSSEFGGQSHFSLSSALSIFLSVLCLFLVVTGILYSGWQRVHLRVLQSEDYRFSAASVHVTKTPPWVPETIVNDVISDFHTGRASQETLIDRKLLKALDGAFRAYHWVESVDRIRASFPATVTIDLTYRTPICMVRLPNAVGAFAVDRLGVYLPSDYFVNNPEVVANHYITIFGVTSTPTGSIGEKWGDVVVEQAAALADHLSPDSGFLGIVSIRVETTGTNRYNTKHVFYLTTSRGTEIIWGEMPLTQDDTRKEHLLKLVRQYGSLDKTSQNVNNVIDLR